MNLFRTLATGACILSIAACSDNNQSNDQTDPSDAPSVAIELPTQTPDFAEIVDVKQKKTAFFEYMFPFIAQANLDIKQERTFITSITFEQAALSNKEIEHLTQICEKYSNNCDDLFRDNLKAELLNEINYVPAGLALAQSANESSWGTSRFSIQGNNYFGQWCYQKGCGIVPSSRNEGATHEVRSFESTLDSVAGYMFNINTHSAYEQLREKREQLQDNQLDSNLLAEGLIRYSERGEEYVKEVQAMIRINDLTQYDERLMLILQ